MQVSDEMDSSVLLSLDEEGVVVVPPRFAPLLPFEPEWDPDAGRFGIGLTDATAGGTAGRLTFTSQLSLDRRRGCLAGDFGAWDSVLLDFVDIDLVVVVVSELGVSSEVGLTLTSAEACCFGADFGAEVVGGAALAAAVVVGRDTLTTVAFP